MTPDPAIPALLRGGTSWRGDDDDERRKEDRLQRMFRRYKRWKGWTR